MVASVKKRVKLRNFVESRGVQNFILAAIIVNAVTLGLETVPGIMAVAGPWLVAIDHAVLGLFVLEMVIKLIAYRQRFFLKGWNLFDFAIVTVSIFSAASSFSILRALRILRVLRLFSLVPQMRAVLAALFSAIPGLGAIGAVLALIFYVFAVIATKLFGADYPVFFGSISGSMYSLFQIMTLDDWSNDIVRPMLDSHPYAWAFFIPFIVSTTFTVLNLFIALIVNSMHHLTEAEVHEQTRELEAEIHEETMVISSEIAELRAEIQALRQDLLPVSGDSGTASEKSEV